MSKLSFIPAGLHPSWVTVADPDPAPAYAHEYFCLVYALGWGLGDLEPCSRFAIASLSYVPYLGVNLSFYYLLKTNKQEQQKTTPPTNQPKKPHSHT